MNDVGRFENYQSMVRASERFVSLLQGKLIASPLLVENVAEKRLPCGHESTGRDGCRKCRAVHAEQRRDRRLPEQLERARLRAAALENEMRLKGMIK